MILDKGYIHVYYGNGKGKSTAAAGLAARMLGAGGKVFLIRFLKARGSSEIDCLNNFETFDCESFGRTGFIIGTPSPEDFEVAGKGFACANEALDSGSYDLVILDEILDTVPLGLYTDEDLIALMSRKKDSTELVLTGHRISPEIEDAADLVSEVREVKHYYQKGVQARKGIED